MLSSARRKAALVMSTVAVFSLGLSVIGTSSASAQTSSTPGVTSSSVTLGLLSDLTGPLSSVFGAVKQGAEARIDQQNAEGGVDGRKIKLAVGDDQSSPTDVLTVAQSLVQQDHVFSIMEETPFFGLVYPYLEQNDIPAVSGFENDGGTEWSNPDTSDLVAGSGTFFTGSNNAEWQWLIKILKQEKITKLALIAYGANAASVGYNNGIKSAAEASGIQVVDVDNSVQETQTDLTSNAIKMKNSGANGWVGDVAAGAEEALITALHQQGASIKGVLLGNYTPQFIQAPLNSIDQGTVSTFFYKTPEVDPSTGNGGGGQLVAALRKYTGYKGTTATPPPNGAYFGWASAELAIQGLEAAGKNLTVSTFLKGLHKQTAYTVGGIQAPANLAQSRQGTYSPSAAGNCVYGLVVKGTKYVPLSKAPFCSPENFYKQ